MWSGKATRSRARGEAIPDALLAHVAPSGWQHINLTGEYLWGADGSLGPDEFRPLRNLASGCAPLPHRQFRTVPPMGRAPGA